MKRQQLFFLLICTCILTAMVCGEWQEGPDTRKIMEEGEPNPWGVTLTAKDVMRGGVTIVCTQSGGAPTGGLNTGAPYWLEELTAEGWRLMETKPKEVAWTAEGWIIPLEDTVEWEVRWGSLYGSLDDGSYRIGKSIMDWRAPGDYDEQNVYAEFTIG